MSEGASSPELDDALGEHRRGHFRLPEVRCDAGAIAPAIDVVDADAFEAPQAFGFAVTDDREHPIHACPHGAARCVDEGEGDVFLHPVGAVACLMRRVLHAAHLAVDVDEAEITPRTLLDDGYRASRVRRLEGPHLETVTRELFHVPVAPG